MKSLAVLMLFVFAAALPARADQVDRYVESLIRDLHIPGAAVAVVRGGRIVKTRGYGIANLETGARVTPRTVFEIGSMTKQFTAAVVMMLAAEGKLSPDDKLSKYFPDAPGWWDRITLRHVLSHTSGIRNHVAVPGWLDIFTTSVTGKTTPSREGLLAEFYKLPSEFEPGESWAYDNTGYILLGFIIERVTGKSYFDVLGEKIFKPLGMTSTRSTDPQAVVSGRANGYAWTGKEWVNRPVLAPFVAFSAGSLLSTVGDIAKWDAALRSGKILSKESLEAMRTPVRMNDGSASPMDYGYGWWIERYRGRRDVLHGGGTPGFSSAMHQFVDERTTVIILTNHADTVLEQAALEIAGMYEPGLRYAKAKDPDPQRMARHRLAFEGLLKERIDPVQFTRPMNLHLKSATGKSFFGWYASLGPVKSFSFLERENADALDVFRYEVKLADNAYRFSFKVTKDGRIAQICPW
jgi:CubicO group peptidase (beta-lactamase class C family)